jgi:hypothetical protein
MTFFLPILFSALLAQAPPQQGSGPADAKQAAARAERPGATPESRTGEQSSAPAEQPPDEQAPDLPVSLSRIRRGLSQSPAIKLNGDRVVFRVEVLGKKPTIEDILGPDYLKGPVPNAGMTHQEFLDMVTPKDVQGYAAFSNREGLTVAATSFALQWALQKAIHKFQTAQEDREREAARKEVQEALADLEKARAKAGLPPR